MKNLLLVLSVLLQSACGVKGKLDSLDSEEISYLVAKFEDSSKSFMSAQVDWDKKLIYAGSGLSNECVNIISFDDINNIRIVGEVTSTSTLPQLYGHCRNVKLYDNNSKLLVSTNNANRLLRYDLGATPEDPTSWNPTVANFLASGGSYARGIQLATTSGATTQVYFSTHTGWFHVELDETNHTFTEQAKNTAHTYNNSSLFLLNDSLVLSQRYSSSTENLNVEELGDGSASTTLNGTIPNAYGGNNLVWTTFSSSDGTKHGVMGNNVTFVDTSGVTPKVTSRQMIPSGNYRASKYVQHNGREYVYAVTGNHYLDVYDITDISTPTLKYRNKIEELGANESYGVDVNMGQNLVVIGTNKGVVVLLDIRGLSAPTVQNDYIPEISAIDSTSGNNEADGSLDVTVSLDKTSTAPVSVDWTTVDGTATAPSDYTTSTGTLTFAPGEISKTISISIVNDGTGEGIESFDIALSSPDHGVIVKEVANVSFSD